jgi:hypothetical protein
MLLFGKAIRRENRCYLSPKGYHTRRAGTKPPAPARDFSPLLFAHASAEFVGRTKPSPHEKDDWEEDILGKDTLPSGQSVEVKFHRDEAAAEWDLRVEDKQGNSIEWESLDLLKISKLTLHYDAATKKATADAE